MLVTSYPVSCDWGASKDVGSNNLKIDTTDTSETSVSDADTITPAPALCSVSNTSMTQEMINIETTVSETFAPKKNDNDNDDTSDYFSTHFENDIQKLGTLRPFSKEALTLLVESSSLIFLPLDL